ncbi:hypothetical protein SCHAM137S_00975 [Streptomyces chartreusis]
MTTTHQRSAKSEAAASSLVTFAAVLLFLAGLLDLFQGIVGDRQR